MKRTILKKWRYFPYTSIFILGFSIIITIYGINLPIIIDTSEKIPIELILKAIYVTLGIFGIYDGIRGLFDPPLKLQKKSLDEIFLPNEKYVFLVGAGISVDSPSNCPTAQEIVENLIKFYSDCPEKLIPLVKHHIIRYEHIIELVQKTVDPNLRILDYFQQEVNSNINHRFLARMLKLGHYVITTNYDNLIEEALIQEKKPLNSINPIITKQQFIDYNQRNSTPDPEKIPIFKLHGAKTNFISGESTKSSLITTISSLNKKKEFTFALDPDKFELFNQILKDRTLVIMGYAGGDTFDVIPILTQIPFPLKIIWINHNNDLKIKSTLDKVKIIKISRNQWFRDFGLKKMDNLNEILKQITINEKSKKKSKKKVYRLDINTKNLIKEGLWKLNFPKDSQNFMIEGKKENLTFQKWLKSNLNKPKKTHKYAFTSKIFFILHQYDEALKYARKRYNISKKIDHKRLKIHALLDLIELFNEMGNSSEFDEYIDKILPLIRNVDNLDLMQETLVKMIDFYIKTNEYKKATDIISIYLGLFPLSKAIDQFSPYLYYYMAKITSKKEHPRKFLPMYRDAIDAAVDFGNLSLKAEILYEVARSIEIYTDFSNLDFALEKYQEVEKIAEELSNYHLQMDVNYRLTMTAFKRLKIALGIQYLLKATKLRRWIKTIDPYYAKKAGGYIFNIICDVFIFGMLGIIALNLILQKR